MTRHRSRSVTFAAALIAGLVAAPVARAGDVAAPTPITPALAVGLLHGGAGNQTDPHIADNLVSYTNTSGVGALRVSEIRYADLATGTNAAIPNGADAYIDTVSDVHGSTIVFTRIPRSGGLQAIYAFDTSRPDVAPWELDRRPDVRRTSAAIGGSTVASIQQSGLLNPTEIVAYDLVLGTSVVLTADGVFSQFPAVSPDGQVVVWQRCANVSGFDGCDVLASTRGDDGWGSPRTLDAGIGNARVPDTNGELVVYADNASGDYDIGWVNVDGSDRGRLVWPGATDENPTISGSFLTFERTISFEHGADLYGYDLATGVLYRLTDTPAIDEKLSDVSVGADGVARVVFAAADPANPAGGDEVYAASFDLDPPAAFDVCPLFDTSKAHRLGSTVPIRVQLCDAMGANVSSPELALTATGLVKQDSSASTALAEDAGNANPDGGFRFDADLAGYAYNLSTRGLSQGTWELRFTVAGDPNQYGVRFDVR